MWMFLVNALVRETGDGMDGMDGMGGMGGGSHDNDGGKNDAKPGHDHSNHGGGDSNALSEDGGMIRGHMMTLFARSQDFAVLFRDAIVRNAGQFVGALIAVAAFAALTTFVVRLTKLIEKNGRAKRGTVLLIGSAIAHAVGLFFHYTAMLLVMSMNIWIILAVLVGHALGWLMFAGVENRIPFIRRLKDFHSHDHTKSVEDADDGTLSGMKGVDDTYGVAGVNRMNGVKKRSCNCEGVANGTCTCARMSDDGCCS